MEAVKKFPEEEKKNIAESILKYQKQPDEK